MLMDHTKLCITSLLRKASKSNYICIQTSKFQWRSSFCTSPCFTSTQI